MHIELVETLRCPRPHEPTWLVARVDEMRDRHILRGALGCPSCGASYPIANGAADFAAGASPPAAVGALQGGDEGERATMLAAMLGLTGPGGFVVLAGEWAGLAPALLDLADGVGVLCVNAPPTIEEGAGVSLLRAAGPLPLRAGACRAIALDAGHAGEAELARAAEALGAGGRLVAPAPSNPPGTVQLLARDDSWWVGEREASARVVRLERRG